MPLIPYCHIFQLFLLSFHLSLYIYQSSNINNSFPMENSSQITPLQLKLDLLQSLRQGNIDQTQRLLSQLAKTTRTHPQLYQQFHQFVSQHKEQIKEIEQEDKEEPQVVCIDDQNGSDGSWETDDSVDLSSHEESQEEQQVKQPSRPLKNMVNSKSAILLKPVKDIKKPFYVQTKPKQNIAYSTVNLRQSSPSSKLLAESSNTVSIGQKIASFAKPGSKKSIKPYFPPINSSKPTLKL